MKLIKKLGTKLNKNGSKISYGEFLCPFDNKIVERPLSNGKKQISCGCVHQELSAKSRTKHGEAGTRLYRTWASMKYRCLNSKDKGYLNYGGRGIMVCPEWVNDYIKFKNWALNNGYQEGLEIDRRDNNLGYSPENCRWVTKTEQNRNQRTTKLNMQKADEIRTKYTSGYYTQLQLSKEYKVDVTIISKIINNKRWKDIKNG